MTFKKFLVRILKKFFYIKLCMDRSDAYMGILMDIFTKGVMFATFLKVFGWDNWVLVVSLMMFGILVYIIWGHIDLQIGLFKIWQSMLNSHNPELQKIIKQVNKK